MLIELGLDNSSSNEFSYFIGTDCNNLIPYNGNPTTQNPLVVDLTDYGWVSGDFCYEICEEDTGCCCEETGTIDLNKYFTTRCCVPGGGVMVAPSPGTYLADDGNCYQTLSPTNDSHTLVAISDIGDCADCTGPGCSQPSLTPSVTPTITITPSVTPTITITPSVTPTITITPSVTPSSPSTGLCTEYNLLNTSVDEDFVVDYTDCDGNDVTATVEPELLDTICVLNGTTPQVISGGGDITPTQNPCTAPVPPSNTPTLTPTTSTGLCTEYRLLNTSVDEDFVVNYRNCSGSTVTETLPPEENTIICVLNNTVIAVVSGGGDIIETTIPCSS